MDEIQTDFKEIIQMTEFRKHNAYHKINEELISLYWDFGKYVSEKLDKGNWGSKTIEEKEFYIKMCLKFNYSKRELDRKLVVGIIIGICYLILMLILV